MRRPRVLSFQMPFLFAYSKYFTRRCFRCSLVAITNTKRSTAPWRTHRYAEVQCQNPDCAGEDVVEGILVFSRDTALY